MEEVLKLTKVYWNEENTKKYEEGILLLISKIKELEPTLVFKKRSDTKFASVCSLCTDAF